MQMQLDTGAAVTLVSEKVYQQVLAHLPLQQCKLTLTTFTRDVISLKGLVNVAVSYETQRQTLPLVIVKGDHPVLLRRNWLKGIRLNWTSIFAVEIKSEQEPEVVALLQCSQCLMRGLEQFVILKQSPFSRKPDHCPLP